ncbi:membrane protein [Bacteroidia bacterium]|nr:membrane protein [Bacteroidia bacterium]
MKKIVFIILIFSIISIQVKTQTKITLNLDKCIELATSNSLEAFKAQNLYLSSYWEYRSFKAGRLPSVNLQVTPIQYNSNFIKRYDYNENIEVYRQQQSIYSSGGLSVNQNFDLTGGTFTLETSLDYMKNFGDNDYSQFSSVPVRIGYSQSLFGFNSFKWEKKIEPLKYEKAKQQYIYSRENISEKTVQYFFSLAMTQEEYTLAIENVSSADSLYIAGKAKDKISAISQSDLQTLHLDLINAQNSQETASINLEKTSFTLLSFLGMDKEQKIHIELPQKPNYTYISLEEALQYTKNNNPDILSYRQQILQAEKEVDQARKSSSFDANISASVGFNQIGDNFGDAYSNPLRQDIIRVGITIPILDWGVRKGRVNMAKNNLNITQLTVHQNEENLEQEVLISVREFNLYQDLIVRAKQAMEIANSAYNITKQRFILGKADVNSITISLSRKMEAQRNYITTLFNYWVSYYKIRKLTLFDFERQESLTVQFDKLLNVK